MNKLLAFLLFMASQVCVFANSAQPGIWSSGGFGHFHLLFPEDSAAKGKISMAYEKVLIDIYPGFAVVKGTYRMKNLSDKKLKFRAGYPLKSTGDHEIDAFLINYNPDKLEVFRILFDGTELPHKVVSDSGQNSIDPQVWYTWQNTFQPGQEHEYQVYFIVALKEGYVRLGYSKHTTIPFIYITESGNTWLNPIGKAEIMVRFRSGLSSKVVEGIWPQSGLSGNGNDLLYFSFSNLIPTAKDNLVLTMDFEIPEGFNIRTVVNSAGKYYNDIDKLDIPVDAATWEPLSVKDFRYQAEKAQSSRSAIILGVVLVLGFGIVALVILAVMKIYRVLIRK